MDVGWDIISVFTKGLKGYLCLASPSSLKFFLSPYKSVDQLVHVHGSHNRNSLPSSNIINNGEKHWSISLIKSFSPLVGSPISPTSSMNPGSVPSSMNGEFGIETS